MKSATRIRALGAIGFDIGLLGAAYFLMCTKVSPGTIVGFVDSFLLMIASSVAFLCADEF